MLELANLLEQLDIENGIISGDNLLERHLSDLQNCFADNLAYTKACQQKDSLVYWVDSIDPANGPGDMHYGIGTLMPGKIGNEYFMTKGHLHSWREAAEIYIGLQGEGVMLLEDERTGESEIVPLKKGSIVYVPGYTAHRTMNTENEKLVYIGIYPAKAGHDYGSIAKDNFKYKVIEGENGPQMEKR